TNRKGMCCMSHCGLGLSCEPLPCEHGKELRKEQCTLCELKTQIMALTDMYKKFTVRTEALHEHKLRQIDENRKVSERMDNMKEISSRHDDLHKEWWDRIEKLEKEISNWEEEFYFLKEKLRCPDKKPHKCPVCMSWPYIQDEVHLPKWICKACDGKGILWG
ncbi:MAG TPA: hypothetical protein VFO37_12785, partial [Chitinophagaceae bacterium]|nr:hypothetical protein [Chitinophagaceae bacterium]